MPRGGRARAQRGVVLIAVVVALVLVGAIAALLTTAGGVGAVRAGRATEALQADHLVHAALNHAVWRAERGTCTAYDLPTTSFGADSYSATFSPASGSPTTVTATATLASGVSRTLSRTQTAIHQAPSTLALTLGTDPGADAQLDGSSVNSNYGGSTYLRVSANPSGPLTGLLRFDLSRIPFGAHIISAQLELRMWYLQTPGSAVVRRVTRSWVEGTRNGGGTADGATWQRYDATNAWTAPGGDLDGRVAARSTIGSGMTWVAFDLAPLVQEWVDGAPNYGAALVGEGTLRTAEFSSRETNNPADRPKLTITYACECGVSCALPQGSRKVLLAVGDKAAPTPGDVARQTLLQGWGYTVTLISDEGSQSAYDSELTVNDVAYIAPSVDDATLGSKLANTTRGVVSEYGAQNDNLGFSSSVSWASGDTLTIADNTHFITVPFATGALRIYTAALEAARIGGSAAPGLAALGTWNGTSSLAALDAGAAKDGGGTAPGRRVLLPLGRNVDLRYLNNNGRVMIQRALEWGATLLPTAYWKLDETSGTKAVDSAGGHDGTLVNGPVWSGGKVDGALAFDGTDDYVDLTSDAALDNLFLNPATVMAWINPSGWGGTNYGRVLDKDDSLTAPGKGWDIEIDGPNAKLLFQRGFSTAGGEWATPPASIALNAWRHVAVVYDGSSPTNSPVIYLDGVAQTLTKQRTPSGSPTSDAAINLRLGNYALGTTRAFNGLIDDVQIYGRAWSAAEIAAVVAAASVSSVPSGGALQASPNCSATFADDFESGGYTGSSGTGSWVGNWLEIGETDGATGGDLRVVTSTVSGMRGQVKNKTQGLQRAVNLSGYTSATARVTYERSGLDDANDYATFDISSDGGATWTELDRFAGPASVSSPLLSAHNIAGFISPNVRIRLLTSGSMGASDIVYFDDVVIEASGCP